MIPIEVGKKEKPKELSIDELSAYRTGIPVGNWQLFDFEGNLSEEFNFSYLNYETGCNQASFLFHALNEKLKADSIVTNQNEPADFNILKRIYNNLEFNMAYPYVAQACGYEGKILFNLEICNDGFITDLSICGAPNPYLDFELYKAITKLDFWKSDNCAAEEAIKMLPLFIAFKLE